MMLSGLQDGAGSGQQDPMLPLLLAQIKSPSLGRAAAGRR